MALEWNLPLRHRLTGQRVYVVAASCTKNQIALGYGKFGPTEEMVVKNGMRSAHSQFLDLENCSEWDFTKQKAMGSQGKAADKLKAKREAGQIYQDALAKQREQDALVMADNPLWGSF